jgi:hypothetical protein
MQSIFFIIPIEFLSPFIYPQNLKKQEFGESKKLLINKKIFCHSLRCFTIVYCITSYESHTFFREFAV